MAKKKAVVAAVNQEVLGAIKTSVQDIHRKIVARKKPTMKFPVRSLANVKYRPDRGYFEIAGQKKERTLTVNTVKTFAQTLRGTYARDAAEHFCPWYSKAPRIIAVRSTSGSAEGCATMKSLPPVSPTIRG